MNYKESKKILEEIKKAKKVIVGCHKKPDTDSVGCALTMYQVLKNLGKEVRIVCPNRVSANLKFLPFYDRIEKIDFKKFNFSDFELFIAVDTPSPGYVTGSKDVSLPEIPMIVIDHHKTNPKYGTINLIDNKISSAAEVLYLILEDWGTKLDKGIATTLLAGIIGDTNVFRYPSVTSQTLDIARRLMELGADKNEIIFNLFGSEQPVQLKFWGEILRRLKVEDKYNFAWSAIPFTEYKKSINTESGRGSAASMFGSIVEGTDFSIIMTEERKNFVTISLRSRTGFDVTKIAVALGGGGHEGAAGARVEGLEFDEAVEKVLQVARKFARKSGG